MCHLKNQAKVTRWKTVEILFQIARGQSKAANLACVISRHSITYTSISIKLNQFGSMLKESNRRLIQSQCSLDIDFENFQIFMAKKYLHAT